MRDVIGEAGVVASSARRVLLAAEDGVQEEEPAERNAGREVGIVGRIGDLAQSAQVEAPPQLVVRTRAGRSRKAVSTADGDEKER